MGLPWGDPKGSAQVQAPLLELKQKEDQVRRAIKEIRQAAVQGAQAKLSLDQEMFQLGI